MDPGAGSLLALLGSVDGACCAQVLRDPAPPLLVLGLPLACLPGGDSWPCSSVTDASACPIELLQPSALPVEIYTCS